MMDHWKACALDIWWVFRWIAPLVGAGLMGNAPNLKSDEAVPIMIFGAVLYAAAVISLAEWHP